MDMGGELGIGEGESQIGLVPPLPHGAAEDGRQRGGVLVVDVDGDEGAFGEVDPQSRGGNEVIEDDCNTLKFLNFRMLLGRIIKQRF
jgi:hypothetical protein